MAPLVREQTVKAVLTVITKLSDRIINGELLKHLAKTSNDEQPGIRTNTTICLGRIARSLGAHVSSSQIPVGLCLSATDEAKGSRRGLQSVFARPFLACKERRATCLSCDL